MAYLTSLSKTKIGFFSRFLLKQCIKSWEQEDLYCQFRVKCSNYGTVNEKWYLFIRIAWIVLVFKFVTPETLLKKFQGIEWFNERKIIRDLNAGSFDLYEAEVYFTWANFPFPHTTDVPLDLNQHFYDFFFDLVKQCVKDKCVFIGSVTEKELQNFLWKQFVSKRLKIFQ